MKQKTPTAQLQSTLTSIEEGLLGATDKELKGYDLAGVKEVRAIIRTKLSETGTQTRARGLPDDAEMRRQLLASIIANHQLARPAMRLAYTSKRRVSDLEVSVLLKKLMSAAVTKRKRGKK